jgi:hypothetical protein
MSRIVIVHRRHKPIISYNLRYFKRHEVNETYNTGRTIWPISPVPRPRNVHIQVKKFILPQRTDEYAWQRSQPCRKLPMSDEALYCKTRYTPLWRNCDRQTASLRVTSALYSTLPWWTKNTSHFNKVTVKLSLCLINKALCHVDVWGSRCIDPRFLDLRTSWR